MSTGVDEIFVEHIKRVLTGDQFRMEQKPTQRMRSTDNGPRWEVDDKGNVVLSFQFRLVDPVTSISPLTLHLLSSSGNVLMVESKVKLTRSDLALISHQYDVRVNVATEVPEGKTSVQHPDKWTIGTYTWTDCLTTDVSSPPSCRSYQPPSKRSKDMNCT